MHLLSLFRVNSAQVVEFPFQYGIVINLLWQIIQSNTVENFTALFITLPCWNVNPKTQKILDWNPSLLTCVKAIQNSSYWVVLDCFNKREIVFGFSNPTSLKSLDWERPEEEGLRRTLGGPKGGLFRDKKSICNPKLGIPNPFLLNCDVIICQVYSAFSNLGWLILAQPFSWHIRQNLKTALSIESIYLRVKTSCRRMRFPSKDFAFESTDIYNS